MKLITLNIWQGRISHNLPPYFASHPLDIICLQEATSAPLKLGPWDSFRALETIADASGLKTASFSPTYGFKVMGMEVKHGNALLTNLTVKDSKTFVTSDNYIDIARPEDFKSGVRNAQVMRLTSPAGEFTVVNHHGHREVDKMGSQVSFDKLELLANKLKSIRGPLIVAGDLNLSSKSPALLHFKQVLGLTDLTLEYGLTDTLSKAVTPLSADCDHILVSSHIRVKSFEAATAVLSDHQALTLDFDLA